MGSEKGSCKPGKARGNVRGSTVRLRRPRRVIAEDRTHSSTEDRYYCIGRSGEGILTVRFTYREGVIRIIGAGYWRKGKQIYERENKVHGRTYRQPKGRG
jgi:uncharacterized DUF497 family protein